MQLYGPRAHRLDVVDGARRGAAHVDRPALADLDDDLQVAISGQRVSRIGVRAVGLSCLTLIVGRVLSRDHRELRFKNTRIPLPYLEAAAALLPPRPRAVAEPQERQHVLAYSCGMDSP